MSYVVPGALRDSLLLSLIMCSLVDRISSRDGQCERVEEGMHELLFLGSLSLLSTGSEVGRRVINGTIADRPADPTLIRLIAAGAAVMFIMLVLFGFFTFQWWLPIAGIIVSTTIGSLLNSVIGRDSAPILAFAFSAFGIVLSIITLAF